MLRGIVSALLVACLLSGCGRPDEPVFRDRFYALGTLIDLSLYGANPEQQLEASEALALTFNTMHTDWHAWEAGRLAQTNTLLAGGRPFRPEADILALLQAANRLSLQSGGLFNPTIGKLIDLWGFHADEITVLTPPDPTAIQELLALAPSAADVVLEDGQLVSRNPAVQYDLGAFAKGYAIDRGIELLQSLGIAHAIINAGGDLRAIGRHGDRPWRIGIRHPRQAGVLASVELSEDESIFTSGDYERFFEASGQRYHHIIDPRTGYPSTGAMSATVIAPSAEFADALATALCVMGPDAGLPLIESLPRVEAILVAMDGDVHATSGLHGDVVE